MLKHNRKSSIMLSVTADKPTPICIKSIEAILKWIYASEKLYGQRYDTPNTNRCCPL